MVDSLLRSAPMPQAPIRAGAGEGPNIRCILGGSRRLHSSCSPQPSLKSNVHRQSTAPRPSTQAARQYLEGIPKKRATTTASKVKGGGDDCIQPPFTNGRRWLAGRCRCEQQGRSIWCGGLPALRSAPMPQAPIPPRDSHAQLRAQLKSAPTFVAVWGCQFEVPAAAHSRVYRAMCTGQSTNRAPSTSRHPQETSENDREQSEGRWGRHQTFAFNPPLQMAGGGLRPTQTDSSAQRMGGNNPALSIRSSCNSRNAHAQVSARPGQALTRRQRPCRGDRLAPQGGRPAGLAAACTTVPRPGAAAAGPPPAARC